MWWHSGTNAPCSSTLASFCTGFIGEAYPGLYLGSDDAYEYDNVEITDSSRCGVLCCPTSTPTDIPTSIPSGMPSVPSIEPTMIPSRQPSIVPSIIPSIQPSGIPSGDPSSQPSNQPSRYPSHTPTIPSIMPSEQPSMIPSNEPSIEHTIPSISPTSQPSLLPTYTVTTGQPSGAPTLSNLGINGDNNDNNNDNNGSDDLTVILIVVLLICIVLLCVCIILVYMYYKNDKKMPKNINVKIPQNIKNIKNIRININKKKIFKFGGTDIDEQTIGADVNSIDQYKDKQVVAQVESDVATPRSYEDDLNMAEKHLEMFAQGNMNGKDKDDYNRAMIIARGEKNSNAKYSTNLNVDGEGEDENNTILM